MLLRVEPQQTLMPASILLRETLPDAASFLALCLFPFSYLSRETSIQLFEDFCFTNGKYHSYHISLTQKGNMNIITLELIVGLAGSHNSRFPILTLNINTH